VALEWIKAGIKNVVVVFGGVDEMRQVGFKREF